MKKITSKLFAVSISALSVTPLLSSCTTGTVVSTLDNSSNELYIPYNGESENKHEACTVTYIGKNCTSNGRAIIARATDCSPKACHLKLQHFKRDEIANKEVVGKLGLHYKMPEHTYAYTSCPLSAKTSSDPTWATENWENNGINEMGVCTSSTLTTATNPKLFELVPEEKFIKAGVGEEMFTQIMTPQAATARQAMEVAAKAIDDYGAQDCNIIMACDQNECWMMEIYSRHQYCAVKMPDDKVMIAGNEFILDSLHDLGINESNKDEMCITSAGLFDTVKNTSLIQYISGTSESQKDIFHMDLFKTYARPLTYYDAEGFHDTDSCHMRTWRGYSLFDKSSGSPQYVQDKKYAPFLTPKNKDGSINRDMSVYDVFEVYRDEFDDIVDPKSSKYNALFAKKKATGDLRTIAVQQTRQVHIMSSDPNRPQWIAADEWYVPDSGNYCPFLQFNNAMTTIDGEYGYYPERFDFDEKCASVLFRELNKLAWYDRQNYGYPLQQFWRPFEEIYCQQMEQVTADAAKLSQNDATIVINNFNKHIRDIYVKQVKKTADDLLWHIMDEPHTAGGSAKFTPLVDLESYVKELGWNNYKFDGTKVTFDRNGFSCEYTISDGSIYAKGTFKMNDNNPIQLTDSVIDNKVYVDAIGLNNEILIRSEVRNININDYLNGFNHLVWIIPVACVAAIGIGVGTFFIIKNRKANKSKSKK